MEKLEVTCPWSGTEGGSVNPKGEMGYRSLRWKAAKEEREKLKEAEMEMDGEMHQKESPEIQSRARSNCVSRATMSRWCSRASRG